MRLSLLRRMLVGLLAALLLVGSAVALAVVWTANERQWYVDTAGIDLTLDVTLTSGGRLLLTALFAALIALALTTLAVELVRRRARGPVETPEAAGTPAPVTGKTFTYRATSPGSPQGDQATAERVGGYDSVIVGKTDSRRSEGTLPSDPPVRDDETETIPPGARRGRPSSPTRPRLLTLDAQPDGRDGGQAESTVPLRGGHRR